MRSLTDLIDNVDSAWPLVQEWCATAKNAVTILPTSREHGEAALLFLQVTTRSPMGAIAHHSGGLLIDHGWLKILGASDATICQGIDSWNIQSNGLSIPQALIVAHDAVGGIFALNGGAFVGTSGHIHYFAPDTLKWEDTELSYSAFIQWACSGDLAVFYQNARWPNWEQDLSPISPNHGFFIWPPLWESSTPIVECSRRTISMAELWRFHQKVARQLADSPPGAHLRLQIDE